MGLYLRPAVNGSAIIFFEPNTLKSLRKLSCVIGIFLSPFVSGKEINPSNKSLTYDEAILRYQALVYRHPECKLIPYGNSDNGRIIQLFVIDQDRVFSPERNHELGKSVLFINNGIHPGEPDGIDASVRLAELFAGNEKYKEALQHVVVCIVPVFNIDGCLNRGSFSRANQNGPEEYGFRGNYQNLDLNRDFVKVDSWNSHSLIKILRQWDPDVLVDTHVSDGADYQAVMTLVSSQPDKMDSLLGNYMRENFSPDLFSRMKKKKQEMCPYVNTIGYESIPDSGIADFLDTPRFLTGYANLFQAFCFISESHMLKPFSKRVDATFDLLLSVFEHMQENYSTILKIRKDARSISQFRKIFPIAWELDTSKFEMLNFKGYESYTTTSAITGLPQLYYNEQKPFEKEIRYYHHYRVSDSVSAPLYYIVPQCWHRIVTALYDNGMRVYQFDTDTMVDVEWYKIEDFHTANSPFEGHYLHDHTHISKHHGKIKFYKGDSYVPVFQNGNRYLVETLEPDAPDSYFNWGFFDAILQQKEWFSPYIFDSLAGEIIRENPGLADELSREKKNNPEMAKDSFSQLEFIYRHSKYFESSYMRYPIYRITGKDSGK